MKKKWLIPLCILLVIAGAVYFVLESPEYALFQMKNDFQTGGIEAILPHLTHEAYDKISPILKAADTLETIGKTDIAKWLGKLLNVEDAMSDFVNILKQYANQIFWDVESIIKNHEKASITLRFDYTEDFCGSIDLELVKVSGNWMINDLYNLNFD